MRAQAVEPTGVERMFAPGELIVSTTDVRGIITYANEAFCRMAAAPEVELLGRPHNVVRHPDMPRAFFAYVWDVLSTRQEIFAYVKNLALDGTHYWAFAHMTAAGRPGEPITGYRSNRRAPSREAVAAVEPLYRQLCEVERSHASSSAALAASIEALAGFLDERGMTYDEYVWSITPGA